MPATRPSTAVVILAAAWVVWSGLADQRNLGLAAVALGGALIVYRLLRPRSKPATGVADRVARATGFGLLVGCGALLVLGVGALVVYRVTGGPYQCPFMGDPSIGYRVRNDTSGVLSIVASGVWPDVPPGGQASTADLAPCGSRAALFEPRYVIGAVDASGAVVFCQVLSADDITQAGNLVVIAGPQDACTPRRRAEVVELVRNPPRLNWQLMSAPPTPR